MAISVSVHGGTKAVHNLSATERLAAQHALSKLSSSHAATLDGGAKAFVKPEAAGTSKLISGSDTFLGGASSRAAAVGTTGIKTAVAGSFGGVAKIGSAHGAGPSSDTINVAGHTAAAVKAEDTSATKATAKITLSDKTTVTLTGVPTHNVIKPN